MEEKSWDSRGLQIDENIEAQRKMAKQQRVGWAILALLVIAVLFGLFGGDGLLSNTKVRSADGVLEAEYERFTRQGAPTSLKVRIAGTQGHARAAPAAR